MRNSACYFHDETSRTKKASQSLSHAKHRCHALHYLRNAASSSFAVVLSSRGLTAVTRISPELASVYAFTVTRRPSLPLSISALTTCQILLSRSLTTVFPSKPTRPARLILFLADFTGCGSVCLASRWAAQTGRVPQVKTTRKQIATIRLMIFSFAAKYGTGLRATPDGSSYCDAGPSHQRTPNAIFE
jgi:hypothetical protein